MIFIDEGVVAERIAQLRMQKGVSARDMSLSIGQSNNYINSIENRKTLPSMRGFFYICEYLDITPQEFFDEGNSFPEDMRGFLQEARKLDRSSFQAIMTLMKKINEKK